MMASVRGSPVILIVVVKKMFRYANVFFYNHLYHPSVFRSLFLKSGITRTVNEKHP